MSTHTWNLQVRRALRITCQEIGEGLAEELVQHVSEGLPASELIKAVDTMITHALTGAVAELGGTSGDLAHAFKATNDAFTRRLREMESLPHDAGGLE